ncbi:peptidogalycan biosysnthesis protein [Methylomicrobium lacus]|uniref:peptidogalycan biosysnthesis protein n=1 Tax=Methylomicrobium lacus TaxID=136992 RepID=UPI0009FE7142
MFLYRASLFRFRINNRLFAQGEHKVARGFEPVITYSAHWISNAGFAEAVGNFLACERPAVRAYRQNTVDLLPIKK